MLETYPEDVVYKAIKFPDAAHVDVGVILPMDAAALNPGDRRPLCDRFAFVAISVKSSTDNNSADVANKSFKQTDLRLAFL